MQSSKGLTGLVLTGGGARGAYQAGVVEGIAEVAKRAGKQAPFDIVTGASAGAINGAYLAATADDFFAGAAKLSKFWSSLKTSDIFRTDILSIGHIGLNLGMDVLIGRLKKTKQARSLLDTGPLRQLLKQRIPFERIAVNIASGALKAFELTATDYQTSESISFVMSHDPSQGWQRARRRSTNASIGIDHVMASSALPLFFPPVKIDGRNYGDGCLRNPAPLSPSIRLGARKLIIIGVRFPRPVNSPTPHQEVKPTLGRVLGVLLNAIMMDATEYDIERLSQINDTLALVPEARRQESATHPIEFLYLQPSIDLGSFAIEQFSRLPETMKFLLGGLGSKVEASEIASYLLFEREYCGTLAKIGFEDALRQESAIARLLYSSL